MLKFQKLKDSNNDKQESTVNLDETIEETV